MRQLLIVLFLLVSASVIGQKKIQEDSVAICSQYFKVPTGVKTERRTIKGPDYELNWTYMYEINANNASDELNLKEMEEAFIETGALMQRFKKKKISCYLLDNEVSGYAVSYKSSANVIYQIYASGIINGYGVMLTLTLNKEPLTNDDIPEFPKQLVKFTK